MTPDELLEITPDLLARAILHRRERLAEAIPQQLDARKEELDIAVPLTRAAKENRDSFDKQIGQLTQSCLDWQNKAQQQFLTLCENLSQQDASHYQKEFESLLQIFVESSESHQQQMTIIEQMKDLAAQQLQKICSEIDSAEKIKAVTAQHQEIHDNLVESMNSLEQLLPLKNEKDKFNNTYLENETMRRRADSRTALLSQALDYSERGIEHWQQLIDKGFDRLLVNAKRVRQGEYSTPALSKMNKENTSQDDEKGVSQ